MNKRLQITLLFIMLCWIWGSTWLAIKLGLNGVPPVIGAALRMTFSGLLLVWLAFALRMSWPKTSMFPLQIAVQGCFQFGFNFALVYWAEQSVPSGLAAVVFAISPMITALVAALIFKIEHLTMINAIGLLIGFFGVGIVYWSEVVEAAHAPALGVAAVLGASTMVSSASVVAKRYGEDISPLALVGPGQFFGGVLLSALAFLTERGLPVHFTPIAIASITYLGIMGSGVAFLAYFYLLRSIAVTRLSLVTYVTPVVAVILGAIVAHEQLAARTFLGAALIFLGIGLVHQRPRLRVEPVIEKECVPTTVSAN